MLQFGKQTMYLKFKNPIFSIKKKKKEKKMEIQTNAMIVIPPS